MNYRVLVADEAISDIFGLLKANEKRFRVVERGIADVIEAITNSGM
jgi:hypothetical protein